MELAKDKESEMNTVTPTAGVTTTAATSTGAAISARGLRKSFGEKTVLDGIDLTVPPGTILALLGPNGAGKTTAVHLLTTYLRPDSGEIRITGEDAPNPWRALDWPAIPLHFGKPWFLPFTGVYYRVLDRIS